ncbi:MAG: hypothetical protein KGO94_03405 [Alphaproteobacteria bacterium]|nr:hypothetical protein [Alphaproteobacteria bacterium]
MKRSTKLSLATALFLAFSAGAVTSPAQADIYFGFRSGYGFHHQRPRWGMRHCNWVPYKIKVWRKGHWVWVWKTRRACW